MSRCYLTSIHSIPSDVSPPGQVFSQSSQLPSTSLSAVLFRLPANLAAPPFIPASILNQPVFQLALYTLIVANFSKLISGIPTWTRTMTFRKYRHCPWGNSPRTMPKSILFVMICCSYNYKILWNIIRTYSIKFSFQNSTLCILQCTWKFSLSFTTKFLS